MPNHTEAEKARIRALTVSYLPTNLERMNARRDCPPLVDQWTDRVIPLILVRGQPVLVRRDGVRKMPGFPDIKRLLNPPFDPNGLRPLSTLLDYSLGFPCGPGRTTATGSSASSTFADIFGGPPPASSDVEATPTRKRKSDQTGTDVMPKALKSSSADDVTRPRKKHTSVRDVIEISDVEDDVLSASTATAKARAISVHGRSDIRISRNAKGKARATSPGEIIDLTL